MDKKERSTLLQNKKLKQAAKAIGRPVAMLLAAIIIVMIFLAVSGYGPSAVLIGIRRAVTTDIAGSIRYITPMILAGIAVCIPFKTQAYNLGVDGQIYMGAIAATAVGLNLPQDMNHLLGMLIIFAAGMAAGAIYALLAAGMKIYCNTDLVLSTLLLNFIAEWFTEYMAADLLRDVDATVQMNASKLLNENFWLPRLTAFGPTSANVGIYIAIAVALLAGFLFFKTSLGYEIKIVGTNEDFARYGGMKPKAVTMKVMGLSGAVAGIIGVIEVTAVQHRLMAGFNPSFGFDGIVVSLLANNNPLGVLLSGTFFGILKNAGANMERATDVPEIITQVTMAIVILAISANIVVKKTKKRRAKHGSAV